MKRPFKDLAMFPRSSNGMRKFHRFPFLKKKRPAQKKFRRKSVAGNWHPSPNPPLQEIEEWLGEIFTNPRGSTEAMKESPQFESLIERDPLLSAARRVSV